jgi:hypothetical protein
MPYITLADDSPVTIHLAEIGTGTPCHCILLHAAAPTEKRISPFIHKGLVSFLGKRQKVGKAPKSF